MPVEVEPIEIVICLGSSCLARGNAQNLALIEEFVKNHGSKASVRFSGKLCQDACRLGPNLAVAGEEYHEVTAAKLKEILERLANKPTEAG